MHMLVSLSQVLNLPAVCSSFTYDPKQCALPMTGSLIINRDQRRESKAASLLIPSLVLDYPGRIVSYSVRRNTAQFYSR